MIKSPSIVPGLDELAELADQYANADQFEIEPARTRLDEKTALLSERNPKYRSLFHAVAVGVKFIRRQADSAKANAAERSGNNRVRNINMAKECIRLRRDPAYDAFCDTKLIKAVGALPRFNVGKTAAIEAVRDGLTDPVNQSRLCQSGQRGKADKRRSIFS
jgi:hypothetical protein